MEHRHHPTSFDIQPLHPEDYQVAMLFLEQVFYNEQNIPKDLLPLPKDSQRWWCIKKNHQLVGLAAAWQLNSEWHWGRLAIHDTLRGLGMGKKIAAKSLEDLFHQGVDKVIIDARDITVAMILKLGGKITGPTTDFYGFPITPMAIHKKDFIANLH